MRMSIDHFVIWCVDQCSLNNKWASGVKGVLLLNWVTDVEMHAWSNGVQLFSGIRSIFFLQVNIWRELYVTFPILKYFVLIHSLLPNYFQTQLDFATNSCTRHLSCVKWHVLTPYTYTTNKTTHPPSYTHQPFTKGFFPKHTVSQKYIHHTSPLPFRGSPPYPPFPTQYPDKVLVYETSVCF